MTVTKWHKFGTVRSVCAADVHAVVAETRGTHGVVKVELHKSTRDSKPLLEIERLLVEMTLEEAGQLAQRIQVAIASERSRR